MSKRRIGQLLVVLSLLIMGGFVLQTGVTDAHAQSSNHAKALSSCYGDGCNGRDPSWYGCSSLAYTVRYANYNANIGTVARESLMYSPNCNAFYTELNSYIGSKWEYVKVQRDSHVYSAGWSYGSRLDSPMVGWNGTKVYGMSWYDSNSAYGQVSYP